MRWLFMMLVLCLLPLPALAQGIDSNWNQMLHSNSAFQRLVSLHQSPQITSALNQRGFSRQIEHEVVVPDTFAAGSVRPRQYHKLGRICSDASTLQQPNAVMVISGCSDVAGIVEATPMPVSLITAINNINPYKRAISNPA